MSSLTRPEAEARAHLLAVARYEVHLDLTGLREGRTLLTETRIAFTCREPGAGTFVDVVADQVLSARLNGADLDPGDWDGERLRLRDLAGDNLLEVVSTTDRTEARQGIHRVVDPADGEVYVWTTFQPDDARRVFACFDQPDLKAPFAFTVTAPRSWTVTSISSPETVDEAGDGTRVWRFARTPPMATYVTTVCAGPFVEVRRTHGGRELAVLASRSLEPFLREQADELLDLTADGLEFFEERFGLPFPAPVYLQVFAPDYQGYMENFGCVVWSDDMIFRAPPSPVEAAYRVYVLLHELAHMWFGDMVSLRWWDDLWLNEAFADWASVWAGERLRPDAGVFEWFVTQAEAGYRADRASNTHAIQQDVPDVDAAWATFDMITYGKGSAVLRQLAAMVSEERFLAALRRYFAAHLWGNAAIDDLTAALTEASGLDLDSWSREWLMTAGTNELTARRGHPIALLQAAPERFPTLRRHRLRVGVYDLDGARLARRDLVSVEVVGAVTELPPLDPPGDLLLLNEEHLTFADVRLDPVSLATALAHGEALPTSGARALLRLQLWREVEEGRLPAADVVRYALRALGSETSGVLRDSLLKVAVEGARLWSAPGVRDDLCRQVALTCLDVARTAPEARRAFVAAAAQTAGPDQLEAVADAAGDDVDLSWRVLVQRSAWGEDVDRGVAALLARDPDPASAHRPAAVRAAAPTPTAKEAAWEEVVVRGSLPTTAWGDVAAAFWQPHQDDVLRPYPQRLLESLPELSGRGLMIAQMATSLFFPLYAVAGDYPDAAERAAGDPAVVPAVAATVLRKADVLRQMLRARSLT